MIQLRIDVAQGLQRALNVHLCPQLGPYRTVRITENVTCHLAAISSCIITVFSTCMGILSECVQLVPSTVKQP